MFLGQNRRYIAMMLSENVMKVIPLVKFALTKIQLASAINIRIKHPDVNQIVPLSNLGNSD
jgi:hypothetical protein